MLRGTHFVRRSQLPLSDHVHELDPREPRIKPEQLRVAGTDGPIQLVHYYSDKSYAGRAFAYNTLRSRLAEDAIIVFDDIQDNAHFMNLARTLSVPFHIFAAGEKYVGVIGLEKALAA